MFEIEKNKSLFELNTFKIEAKADYFVRLSSEEQIKQLLKHPIIKQNRIFVLGGGSNILFTSNFKGVIIKPELKGIKIINEDDETITIKVNNGEQWDSFVEWCVNHNYYGIENLSDIPGLVGSSPIQNIGAYGTEVKNYIITVEGYDIYSGEFLILNNFDCEFGYRTSIFKTKLQNRIIVSSVVFRLYKKPNYCLNYPQLVNELKNFNEINIKNIRNAVIKIRSTKLPDPNQIGNAGSFFKNPEVLYGKVLEIKNEYPDVQTYKTDNYKHKISAAWLIEKCGWKGYRKGNVGVYFNQPLVLVNYGGAQGIEILELAQMIQESVRKKFKIDLETEVNIIA